MYIESVPNRHSPPAILLRESYREAGKVRKRTLANLSKWPPVVVEGLRILLKGGTAVADLTTAFDITRSRPHGHVAAVLGTLRKLRLDRTLAATASPERERAIALIVARILAPGSKLATARDSLAEMLGIESVDEDELYAAMDWLLERQGTIEKRLARRHLSDGALVLYDLTSTYFEGRCCPLAKRGYSRPLSSLSVGDNVRRALGGLPGAANDDGPLAGREAWARAQGPSAGDPETGGAARGMTGRQLLLGSSFHLAAGGGEAGGPGYAAWGRIAVGGFEARAPAEKGTVRLDGEVTTGILGADAQWERWLAGVALSVSEGEGSFDQPGVDSGSVESSLTSVIPYVRYEASDRLSVWGLLGYGAGDMRMTQAANDDRDRIVTRTDISMRLGAAGARGVLLEADEDGGIDLALRGDAFVVEMESEKAANTVETKAEASRLRLVLEAGRSIALGEGAVLAPALELGLRHDGGDAETGTGVELGGRIRYTDAGSGLTVEANASTLIAHEDSGYREWGAGGSVRLDPGASGRGLSFSLAPVWGAPSSGVERLWSAHDAAGLTPGGEFEAERRLQGKIGYGIAMFDGGFTGTPNLGVGFSETGRDYRVGWRLTSARRGDPGFRIDLDATRREAANADAEHGLMLRGTVRW